MFYDALEFNQDIADWNTSNVKDMKKMFRGASTFNRNPYSPQWGEMPALKRDLSSWCVSQINSKPTDFAAMAPLGTQRQPDWGTNTGCSPEPEETDNSSVIESLLDTLS
jgi:surface protein